MPFGLGFFATAGVSAAGGSYELITSTILTGSQSSVTFSNLGDYSSTYQHLQIRYVARTDRGTYADDAMTMTFNNDTTSGNYKSHVLSGGGSSGFISGVSSDDDWFGTTAIGNITTNVASSGIFGSGVIDIFDPYENKNTTSRNLSGFHVSDTAIASYAAVRIQLSSHLWMNTNAVSSITLDQGGGSNFVQYSRFSLYGLKASA